jgi:hypothetical protein
LLASASAAQNRAAEGMAILEPQMEDASRLRIGWGELCRIKAQLLAHLSAPAADVDYCLDKR